MRQEHPRADDALAAAPGDPSLRAAALATVPELDALAAMRGEVPLDTLVDDRDAQRGAVEEVQRLAAEQSGHPAIGNSGGTGQRHRHTTTLPRPSRASR